ncbi:MAG: signal peptidase I [Gemmatimonadetes bacterium]|nr:signal peptidase I [Gemmatimonadota bacterium]MDE3258309.1 signal peptidase I [Gemmatimonadota bacterium]
MAREYLEAILVAVALALFLRTFVVQAFSIPTGSMENTLLIGDFLLANKIVYGARIPFTDVRLPGFRNPEPGDIVIFEYPKNPERDFIKRVVAGPGQKVEIRDKILYVDGKRTVDPPLSKYVDPVILPVSTPGGARDNMQLSRVPEGHYFVMGDNRDNSEDSRSWGFLEKRRVRAQANIIYWSWAPDSGAPAFENVLSIPKIAVYNLIHGFGRARWSRLGRIVK